MLEDSGKTEGQGDVKQFLKLLNCSSSCLINANHVILMGGGGFNLLTLKVTTLVNLSLVVNQLLYDYVNSINSVNMFL